MIEISHDTTCHGSVLALAKSGNRLLAIDNTYHFTTLSPATLAPAKNIPLSTQGEPLYQFSKAMDINADAHLLYTVGKEGCVYHADAAEGLKILSKGTWHEGSLGSMSFDPVGRYYATGGHDGRVHLFEYATDKWVTSFDIRPDYISELSFSADGDYLLSAAYDKQVFMYDMVRIHPVGSFETSSVTESARFFDGNHKVCCVTRHKSFEVYDRRDGRIIFSEPIFDAWPTVMITDERERYALVGTKQNTLYIISLDSYSVMAKIPLEVQGISLLSLTDDALYVGTEDGIVMRAERLNFQADMEEALRKKAYPEAALQLEKNALLYFSEATEAFEAEWPDVLAHAKELLEAGKIEEAIALTSPFTKLNPNFSKEFLSYFSHSEEILNLKSYIDKKLYQPAYELIDTYPAFRELHLYKELEEAWFGAFKKARKYLASATYEGKLEAEKILHPFSKVPEKEQSIVQLMASASVFENAEALIRQKAFPAYFQLVEKFDFLKSTELYMKTLALGTTLHNKEVRLEQEKAWEEAIELLKFLSIFPAHKKHALARIQEINDYLRFTDLVAQQNQQAAYALAEKSPYIQSSDEFQALVATFNAAYEHAGRFAEAGAPKKVLESLSLYFSIPFWSEKTRSLMKSAYVNEIAKSDLESIDTKATLERYISLFGKDAMLEQAIGNIPDLPETVWTGVNTGATPKEQIAYSDYYESILVYPR